eukprot:CAMPEP_0196804802 /NCGR_PEP_ID=MMETSP1362-20130617/4477_1 /TAXON_ID=163516 /ORGANISM="Leptocylindrus danicus, Strain CCMP1856" /LENGTH=448 /DNA_ID=CAMNT_0042177315 /DNA_START=176 /DNA_END=1522 /DNA_ORIENTATION=+
MNSSNNSADMEKWERMFAEGEKKKQEILGFTEFDSMETVSDMEQGGSILKSEVKVVTFDLDNTLWKTGAVIKHANDVLQDHLDSCGLAQPRQVKDVMKELFSVNQMRYCPELATNPEGAKIEPVMLTQLRKDSIFDVCVKDNGFTDEEAEMFSQKAFQVWTDARHAAIPAHLAESVVECLSTIRGIQTSSGLPIIIGAITNGNSDPRNVPMLRDYFDFCVNSEDVGVSKPDPKVYKAAVEEASGMPAVRDIFAQMKIYDSFEDFSNLLGPWWVHVGDDFLKDVVAAKELMMRTVWARELVLGPEDDEKSVPKSKRTLQELVRDMASQDVITMEIGSTDYLAETMKDEFADCTIDRFEHLVEVILGWHREGLSGSANGIEEKEMVTEVIQTAPALPDYFDVIMPEEGSVNPGQTPSERGKLSEKKFCMFCGTKLPMVAKFCSSCGNSQE